MRAERPARLQKAAPLFFALGDETRLRIVGRLCRNGPSSITQLSGDLPVTRQAVSKHLRVLAGAGLVRVRRAGRESICEIRHEQLQQAQRWLDDISRQWDGALSRLQRLVES